MRAILAWFEKFDIIGPEFNFERNGSSRFKTLQGSFLSIIILVSAIILAFQFGQDIYQRKLPSVSTSKELINNSEIYMQDFPVMFIFTTSYGNNISLSSTLDVWAEETIFDEKSKMEIKIHNLISCNEVLPRYKKYQNLVSQLLTEPYEFYCLNFTESSKIQNELSVPNSSFFSFNIRYCKKEERSDCNHDPVLLKEPLAISLSYVNNFVDATNYTDPVQSYIVREVYVMSFTLTKVLSVYYTYNEFVSDNGWLVEDIKKINYVQFSDSLIECLMSEESNNLVYQVYLSSTRIRIKDKRVYLKIQELLARIGGIINGFVIAMNILSYHYLRFKYIVYVWKNSFNMIDEEYVINMIKKDNNFLNVINKDNLK
jgi:hypothetical protein